MDDEQIRFAGSIGESPRGYWILITGQAAGTNRYAWSQVNDADTGFGTSLGAGFAMSGTSATTGWPAYEVNGRQDVPADSTVRVLAFPSAAGYYWTFEYDGTAGGPGTAGTYPGWYMGLTDTSCLVMTVESAAGFCSGIDTTQTIFFRWSGTSTAFASTTDFDYDTGSGPVLFWLDVGEPHLSIDGVELSLEARGNGYLIFAGGGTTLCDGTASECADNTFRVRIECEVCPEPVTAECVVELCPDGIPRYVVGIISNKTGDCSCLPDTTPTLIYNEGGLGDWRAPAPDTSLCSSNGMVLACVGLTGSRSFSAGASSMGGCGQTPTAVSTICDPFELVIDVIYSGFGGSCPCTGGYRVTFVEAPPP